jgi:SAM-dependent methyltransferase
MFKTLLRVARIHKRPDAFDYTKSIVGDGECRFALDIGCGGLSPLSVYRPKLKTVGIDAFPEAIQEAKSRDAHDFYILADVLNDSLDDILSQFKGEKFDLVTLYGVIEHFPKRSGYDLLERCEKLTNKYILLQTPNGFVEQGPEFGNENQRHLSGWFPQDFEGLGYKVYGTTGLKCLRGYASVPKYRHTSAIEQILTWLLRTQKNPKYAFNLVASKDIRGVPARL